MNVESEIKKNDIELEYDSLSFENYTLREIKKAAEENKFLDKLVIEKKAGKIIIYDKEDHFKYCIIFDRPVTCKYCIKTYYNNISETEQIISTIQIDNKILNYKIKDIYFSFNSNNKKYFYKNEIIVLENINVNKINIDINIYEKFIYFPDNSIIRGSDEINKYCLSLYFPQYFRFYNNESFEYFNGKNRENLMMLLRVFIMTLDINFLKICGPSHIGKSTTLLRFSRMYANIIYFNLKVLLKYTNQDNDKINFHSIISYELNRIVLNKEEGNKLTNFYNNNKCNSPCELIYEIIKFFINKNIVFIFDQFKSNNFDSIQYNKIECYRNY